MRVNLGFSLDATDQHLTKECEERIPPVEGVGYISLLLRRGRLGVNWEMCNDETTAPGKGTASTLG